MTTIKISDRFNHVETKYYTKPEESKFKIGDWVIIKNRIGFVYTICKDTGKICIHGSPDITNWYDYSNLKLWKPQPGEWCWFWDFNQDRNSCTLAKYSDKFEPKKPGAILANSIDTFEYCEPFIGQLPMHLKNN